MPPKKKAKRKAQKSDAASPQHQPRDPEEVLRMVLHRILQWLRDNYARTVDLFHKLDSNQDNHLSCDEFVTGMRMLEAPVTRSETSELIKILDINHDGQLDILEFDRMIRKEHRRLLAKSVSSLDSENEQGSTPSLMFSPSRVSTKCPNCEIGRAEPPSERNPRYLSLALPQLFSVHYATEKLERFILLKITLAPFKDFRSHPGHFELEVTDSTSIQALKGLINDHLGGVADSIALFKEASCSKQSYLVPSWCLQHCGMVGGPKMEPVHAEVFYDYNPPGIDCPILMSDGHIKEGGGAGSKNRAHQSRKLNV